MSRPYWAAGQLKVLERLHWVKAAGDLLSKN